MNSSTSTSDAALWRRFAITLVAVTATLLVALVVAAYALDPYDSGRSALFEKSGVRPQGPRTANASRGRDGAFNAAIFGNSRIQLIQPERLNKGTGLDFVQLSVPGSGPKEHLALIDWFLRHRKEPPKALVVSVDDLWCTADPELTNQKPFPFWLYSPDRLDYAEGLLRYDVLEEMPQRIAYLLDDKAERARPDGYWDYEPEYLGQGYGVNPAFRKRLDQTPYANAPRYESDPLDGQRQFPAIDRLKGLAATLPEETALIIVIPPFYKNWLPPEGTEQAFLYQACTKAISAAVRERQRAAVVDWRVDRPEIRDPDLFFDSMHYRHPLARLIEKDIVGAIRRFP